jgi:anti-anti-sigma factor
MGEMREHCDLDEVDGVPIIGIFGDSDLSNVNDLHAMLAVAERSANASIVVSLMHAEYFDSSTIHALLAFGERLQSTDRRLIVVGPSGESARRILSIFGLATRIPIFDTLPQAIASAKTEDLSSFRSVEGG